MGWLIVCAIVLSPFIWLHHNWGWLGVIGALVLVIALFFLWANMGNKASLSDAPQEQPSANDNDNDEPMTKIPRVTQPSTTQPRTSQALPVQRTNTFKNEKTWTRSTSVTDANFDDFSKYVMDFMSTHKASDWEAAGEVIKQMMRINFPRSQFLRSVQIVIESGWIVVNGKNKDTIDGRMETINQIINGHVDEQNRKRPPLDFSQVNDSCRTYILSYVNGISEAHKTSRYLNEAISIVAKADKLKTESGRKKRVDVAVFLLLDGVAKSKPNSEEHSVLKRALDIIPTGGYVNLDLVALSETMWPISR